MEKSYPIKKIITHAEIDNEIPNSTPVWISSDLFESNISVERYWKNISKTNLKAQKNNISSTRDNIVIEQLIHPIISDLPVQNAAEIDLLVPNAADIDLMASLD
jgi:hypothetical protein